MKKAVLLLNLGSPDSLAVEDVKSYLGEFLMDERVIDVPGPLRTLLVKGIILNTRPRQSAEAYEKVWTDEGSPLIVTSKKQQALLSEKLDIPVYLAMRYRNPSTPDVIRQMKKDGIEHVFVIPLYPHYSMSSYETAFIHCTEQMKECGFDVPYDILQPYYNDPDYIDCLVERALPFLSQDYDHLLFSFHGIPERHLRKSDPTGSHCLSCDNCCDMSSPAHATCYRHQCLETVKAFVKKANIPGDQFSTTFQSRLGRDPWLQPYTDFTLENLPQHGKKKLLVICPAFISDCLETLEEINMSGRESFMEAGGETFDMIPCLNDSPKWIDFMAAKTQDWQSRPADELTSQMRWFYPQPKTAQSS
ncbi:MAG: ferrochelatase [Verrucomicrobiota bacterium]